MTFYPLILFLSQTLNGNAYIFLIFLGLMSRTRFIIMPTQGEGRPCPTELTQQKTCPVTPCYSWVLGNWSACKLEVGHVMTLGEMLLSVSKAPVCSLLGIERTHFTHQECGTMYFYAMEDMEKYNQIT